MGWPAVRKPWPGYNLPPIRRGDVKLSFAQDGGPHGALSRELPPHARHVSGTSHTEDEEAGTGFLDLQGTRRIFRKMLQSIFNIDRVFWRDDARETETIMSLMRMLQHYRWEGACVDV